MADDGSDEDNMVVEVASTGSGETFYSDPNDDENEINLNDPYEGFSGSSNSDMEPEYAEARGGDGSTQAYDPEVTLGHSYMGNMTTVPGMTYYDPRSTTRLYYCYHNHIVFPGEIIPIMLCAKEGDAEHFGTDPIGLVFGNRDNLKRHGVTCQVIEKRITNDQHTYRQIRAKLRVLQRFKVVTQIPDYHLSINLLPCYSTDASGNWATVEILPELQLGPVMQPIGNLSVERWANNKTLSSKLKRFQSCSYAWPEFVYSLYDIGRIMMKIQYFSVELKNDNMPQHPMQCSFWSARNLPISDTDQAAIFKSNYVETRMLIIEKNLNATYAYCCMHCDQRIANFQDVFPMTKDGVQASYCNKNGFIHETVTVSSVEEESLAIEEHSSTRFSWFPGYSWRIAYCVLCSRHKGWKFTAVSKDLTPKYFYGLSRSSVLLRLCN